MNNLVSQQSGQSYLADADLLEAWIVDQQASALTTLVDRYSVMVLSVCRRRCRSLADAEDAFQSTFLLLARDAGKIRQPERLAGWLHCVAHRVSSAIVANVKREPEPMTDPQSVADPPRLVASEPLEQLAKRHEALVLNEELAELPAHYRSAIVLHLLEGFSIQQVADKFQTTAGSVRGRLQRGKQLLSRRLRQRGIVPIVAFAAVHQWTVSAAEAAGASQRFSDVLAANKLPAPPIDPPRLDPIHLPGVRLMPTILTSAAFLAGTAVLALFWTANDGSLLNGQAAAGPPTRLAAADALTPPTVQAQFGSPSQGPSSTKVAPISGAAPGQVLPAPAVTSPPMRWEKRIVDTVPDSLFAEDIMARLDEPLGIQLPDATTLAALPNQLDSLPPGSVILDQRGLKFAQVDSETALQANGITEEMPLRVALRRLLHPHGLQAIVENDGLLITADPAALVHQGIGVSRWVNLDTKAADRILEQLSESADCQFYEVPLSEALTTLSAQQDLPFWIDERALEEEGLTADLPVTLTRTKTTLQNLLHELLDSVDLTLTIEGDAFKVTTHSDAEDQLLTRIYWLEGTGIPLAQAEEMIETIQMSVHVNSWDQMGGSSSMMTIPSKRPAILVSATLATHADVSRFFEVMRETQFGAAPEVEHEQVPDTGQQFFVGGGGGMGGGGFF
ncbi:ECF RNA polymerase sigma factor SigE [Roseimaritima multifibrata]|uniref:ECF RNA polymerase sigma factor SigE n=1 Tax=Roseimaritima multifibrata TaxID=1930274 RepID=A0A517MHU5_9BACT|nr:sigma-70 family RNA polymerase sigma factor [Roseimaritima multifibrata]QDS94453.1 ECF RNA polymerase sigma factor SigE [Roseimaritima multifibrata]